MSGILLVSSFYDVCSVVFRSISWARCLLVVAAESDLIIPHVVDGRILN